MMEINMLPVNDGDCIHIRFSDSFGIHNIVVDSGPSTAKRKFRGLLNHIYESGEVIDLLCFSHIHDDHIRAAAQIIPEETYISQSFIKKAWLNIGEDVPSEQGSKNYYELSVHSASELYSSLKQANIPVLTDVVAGMKFTLGDAAIDILSPDEIRHDKYIKYWNSKTQTQPLTVVKDTSIENGDSIAFMLCLEGRQFLFLGDAYADVVSDNLKSITCNGKTILAKLSHHGSRYNMNQNLLDTMNTTRFLISAGDESELFTMESMDILEAYMPGEEKWLYCNFKHSLRNRTKSDLHLITMDSSKVKVEDDIWIFSRDYEE